MEFVESPAGYNAFPISCTDASGNTSKLFSTLELADSLASVVLKKDSLAFSTGSSLTSNNTGTFLDTTDGIPLTVGANSTVFLGSANYDLTIPAKVMITNDLSSHSLSVKSLDYTNVNINTAMSTYSKDDTNKIVLDYANTLVQIFSSSTLSGGLQVSDSTGKGVELYSEDSICRLWAGAGGLAIGQKDSTNSPIASIMNTDASGNLHFGVDITTENSFRSYGTVNLMNAMTTVPTMAKESNDNSVASTAFVKSVGFDVNADHTWGDVQTFGKPLVASWDNNGTFHNLGYSASNSSAIFPSPSDNATIFTFVPCNVGGTYMIHLNCTFNVPVGSQIKRIESSIRGGTVDGSVLYNARSFYPNVVSGNSEVVPVSMSTSLTGFYNGTSIVGAVHIVGATGVTVVYTDFLINLSVTRIY